MSRYGYALWIALALACGSAVADGIRWAPDLATARRAAVEFKVPVLVHFYGDNCLPCKLLEQNVYSRPEIVDTLNKYFICVRINASQDGSTAAQYGVHSWPTDVFLGPDGKPLDQGTCKQNPGEYLSVLHNMAVLNRDRNVLLASQQSESSKQLSSQLVGYPQPAATQAVASATAAAGLPTPGALHPNNPNGPNYYVAGPTAPQAQLPLSLAPNTGVISGPILAHNQPPAITTPVMASASQIAPGSAAHSVQNNSGHLPPVYATAQIPPAVHPTQIHSSQMQVAGAATVPANPASNLVQQIPAPSAAWQAPVNRNQATASELVENPHFPGLPPVTGALATPQALTAQAAASVAMPTTAAVRVPTVQVPAVQVPAVEVPAVEVPAPPASPSPRIAANTVSLQPRAALSFGATRTVAAAQPTPALDGFCPITLKSQGAWVKGQSQWAVKHRGKVYHLSSQAAAEEFLRSPDRSSPVLAGYDPMVFLNEGRLVEGNVQHGLHEQVSGTILLFSSPESKLAYERDYDRNMQALQVVLRRAGIEQ